MTNRSASYRRLPSLIAAVAVAAGASVAMADTMNSATRANPERAGSSASTSGSYGATGNRNAAGASYGTSGTAGSSTTNYSDTANVTSSPTYSQQQAREATQGTGYGQSAYGTDRPTHSGAPVNTTTGEANFHDGRPAPTPGVNAPLAADTSGPKTREQVRNEVLRARMTGQLMTTNPAIAWAPAHIDVNTYHGETSVASREEVRQEARDALRNQQGANPSRDYRLGSPSVIPQQPTANAGNAAE
jgi:hypothetical protein